MLPHAAVKVASRETEVAAQVMDVEALRHKAGAHGRRFGAFKRVQGAGQVIDHPHARRQTKPRAALLGIGFGKVAGRFEGRDGGTDRSQRVQHVAMQAGEREAVGASAVQRQTALYQ